MRSIKKALGAICLAGMLGVAGSVSAITYTLNTGNSALPTSPLPYGFVNVSLSGNVATITFTSANGYFFVDGGSAAVNVNGSFSNPTILVDSPTSTPNDISQFSAFDTSNGNEDGLGRYNLALNNQNASTGVSEIQFSITGSWSSDASVLAANDSGFFVAAHIQVPGATIVTGFAADGSGSVPDGGLTVAMLGSALVGIGLLRRRFSRS